MVFVRLISQSREFSNRTLMTGLSAHCAHVQQDLSALKLFSRSIQKYSLLVLTLAVMFCLPVNSPSFAQSDLAEIEFWQSVKASQSPEEFQAYLDLYPQGKFAPLARLRINRLSSKPIEQPVEQPVEPATTIPPPPPLLDLPVFKPDNANVTDASCQANLGRNAIAEADFTGTGYVCLCRPPFGISIDGTSCIRNKAVERITPRQKPRKAIAKPRPAKVKRKSRPVRVKRKSVKRPPRARARAIANSYCRRRYGARLKNVVVKKSKFYCHYQLVQGNNSSIGVKKKRFKDVSR